MITCDHEEPWEVLGSAMGGSWALAHDDRSVPWHVVPLQDATGLADSL